MVHPANTPLGRFGIRTLLDSPDLFIGSMPMTGLTNPVTGAPTIGPLAVLVDFVAGLVNHHRRAPDEWTVSTELSMDLTADAHDAIAQASGTPVVCTGRPVGAKGSTSLSQCELTHGDTVIGVGTVRSAHIGMPGKFADLPPSQVVEPRPTELVDIMALRVISASEGSHQISQAPHPDLNNAMGIVNGGVAAAGLELAAAAALNHDRGQEPLHTVSLRVSFVGKFLSGNASRYEALTLRRTRRSGLAQATATGSDGRVALTGWVSATRQ